MSNENAAYVYQNVGLSVPVPSKEATAYTYQNIGLRASTRVGAVYGLLNRHLLKSAYVYQNVTT